MEHNIWKYVPVFFIVTPCILITLKFLRPTNALIYTYKMLKHTVKISRAAPTCFGPFGPSSGSLC
jgi:hypothetical protein